MSDPTYYYSHPIYGTYGINPPKTPHERTMVEHVQAMSESPKIKRNPYSPPMTKESWDKHPQKIQMDDIENRERRRSYRSAPEAPSPKGSYSRKK